MSNKILIAIIVIFILVVTGMVFIFVYNKEGKSNINNTILKENQIVSGIEELNHSSGEEDNSNMIGTIDFEKISIKIDYNSISNTGVTIIITDNNNEDLPWTEGYKIQKKVNGNWIELNPINELITSAISHWKDEKNQYKQQINWNYSYGELDFGEYRIVKPIYNPKNNCYIDLYSDEFKLEK